MVLFLMSRVAGRYKYRRALSPSSHLAASPLFATLTGESLTVSKHATLTPLFAALTKTSRVSPLFATLTENTGGGVYLSLLPDSIQRYLLTPFLSSTYTHFSVSSEDSCT